MPHQFQVIAMTAPGGGSNKEKFYFAVEDPAGPFVLYGANTPNASGTMKTYSKSEFDRKVREKLKKYTQVHPGGMPAPAIDRALATIRKNHPELVNADFEATWDMIDFSASGASARPRTRKKSVHFWF